MCENETNVNLVLVFYNISFSSTILAFKLSYLIFIWYLYKDNSILHTEWGKYSITAERLGRLARCEEAPKYVIDEARISSPRYVFRLFRNVQI